MYAGAVQIQVTGGWITHLAGTPWYAQRTPRRWHHCTPATTAHLGVMYPDLYQRCACGGWRVHHFGGDPGFGRWQERNSLRNGTAHSLTIF